MHIRTAVCVQSCCSIGLAVVLGGPLVSESCAETAEGWLRRSQAARFPGGDFRADFELVSEAKDGTVESRSGITFRRSRGESLADRLMVFRSPPRLAGLVFLSKDRAGEPADQWVYMPVYRRARRISFHRGGDALVGSDFMYADVGRVRIEAGEHRLRGNGKVGNRDCVLVETMSKDPNLPYARLLSKLDSQNALPLRVEHYGADDQLTRVLTLDEVIEIDGMPTPTKVSVTNEVTGGRSALILRNAHYNVGLESGLFTVERLEDLQHVQ